MFKKLFFVCAALVASTATAAPATEQGFFDPQVTSVYQFNPKKAAGVKGHVVVHHRGESSTKARIAAHLDFNGVDQEAIKKFEPACVNAVVEYKWHIHVNWASNSSSDSFAACAKTATGNHYDPLYACGPNSEYVGTPQCVGITANYTCNPTTYGTNPLACEKGDLSGKFGTFKLDANNQTHSVWEDNNYPLVSEHAPTWNIILHAICGAATPRIACAQLNLFDF